MKIHPQTIIFQNYLVITSYLILPLTKIPSITKEGSTSINPIPEFTIGFTSPDGQSLKIDAISEKIKIQSFKDNILQNLRENIIEIFDAELVNFKAHCEDLVKKCRLQQNSRSTTR